MAKDPIPPPRPDVVRTPTPPEDPAPHLDIGIPAPKPEVERSPLPSNNPQNQPEEMPKRDPA